MCLLLKGPALTSQGDKPCREAKGEAWDHQKPGLFKVKPNWNSRNISLNSSLLHGGRVSDQLTRPKMDVKRTFEGCRAVPSLATNTVRGRNVHTQHKTLSEAFASMCFSATNKRAFKIVYINAHYGFEYESLLI